VKSGRLRIGTSGWHYPHWRERFYPRGLASSRRLEWYARHFDTVEINASFYRLPTPATVAAWRDGVPASFEFAVKASRYLTHMKKLSDPEPALAEFLPVVAGLGSKLGPILFQLPPRWRANPARLASLLELLPTRHRYAFELRDPSWFTPGIEALLERHGAAFCIYELGELRSPFSVTAPFVYVRLHGPERKYAGSYGERELAGWSERVQGWLEERRDVYVYFDNDEAAYAVDNALALRRKLEAAVGRGAEER
jgi:uncharacterized protein YecE (DUF72 family)